MPGSACGKNLSTAASSTIGEQRRRTTRSPRSTDVAGWLADEPDVQVVDVRNPEEAEDGVIPGARNLPLAGLLDRLGELDPDRPTIVYCAGGYRSSVAASTLRAHGFGHVADLIGGYGAWRTATAPTA